MEYQLGCRMPTEDWLWLNRTGIFEDPGLRQFVAPFPAAELRRNVAASDKEFNFASVGSDFYAALSAASAKPLTEYRRLLDFGCGCGRFLRMLKGHPHEVFGCDIDSRYVEWVRQNLPFVQGERSGVKPPLPYPENQFDCIISISVFSHLNEKSQNQFLRELFRISMPGAVL